MSIGPIGAGTRIPVGRALVPVSPARRAENDGGRAMSRSMVVRDDFARTAYGSPDLAARTRAACQAYQSRGFVTEAIGGRLGVLV